MDAVLTEFIERYENVKHIHRAIKFAKRHRALAMGASGYHSYLQSKMIPFESMEAKMVNNLIFKTIQTQAWAASEEMGEKYGKPEVLADPKYKRRHTTLTAVAPNTSSSTITGIKIFTKMEEAIVGQQSPSIEPYVSNYYIKKTDKLELALKNPYLKRLLMEKSQDTFEVWESILKNEGSVRHLDFLTEEEKSVFKIFIEISQKEIVIQAAARQKHIDQGQSLNLMIHPSTPTKDVNKLILEAEELGIKTLYYQLGQNAAQAFARDILSCESCAG
jgi:ribonucleoside-diphosphate reductase alpha chain